mmetsp:Transcript_2230/g.3509  ORF Transcript_2230/g.3509 Transcript_2230/m.3509 type:complete len:283 (-) Transcript_2230:120-968(-)|eukprot:CAMPEP_0175021224 /NCGR_PEP_ID=MMETSP0005-20121125/14587_1 /TAXON_ID=420556 /ORGANISM="Ochromonas sp., Strain CCMP1393" /LENGTH=282 /DNA_ID=CAMNT_0016279231 /DNA_START=48 /DNA_END=896 /DNA_ORIENTATION=+
MFIHLLTIASLFIGVQAFRIAKSSLPNSHLGQLRASPFDDVAKTISTLFAPKEPKIDPREPGVDLTIYDEDISRANDVLLEAATTKKSDPEVVVEQLLALEKLMRKKNKLDEGATADETLKGLKGAWRLIFTTGTVKTQEKFGKKINYFPIKAVQCFNTDDFSISNGIYLGNFPVLRFVGEFEWQKNLRKVFFDFSAVYVLGFKINIKKGDAVKIGTSTGLGSDASKQPTAGEIRQKKGQALFSWISATDDIATARGGGGGLALWKRDEEMEAILLSNNEYE